MHLVHTLDIDSGANKEILTILAEKTNTPTERLFATTLAAFEGSLFERWTLNVGQQWVMPITVSPRKIKYGLQYCPLCLAAEEPYYRRVWRLAFVTLCTEHRVQLLDRCAQCSSPVLFHKAISNGRYAPPSDRMTFCYSCKADLRGAKFIRLASTNRPADEEICLQEHLEKALHRGWVEMPGGGTGYSLLYFPVLHRLTRLLTLKDIGTSLRTSLSRKYRIRMFNITFTEKRPALTQLSVGERRGLLDMVRRILTNWPDEFSDFCADNRISARNLWGRLRQVPFWFWRVVNEHVYHPPYRSPKGEIESAVLYLKKMRKQYPRRPRPYPKEMRAAYDFLITSSPLKRQIRKKHRVRGLGRSGKTMWPRRMPGTLWKEVEGIIISNLKICKLESGERRKLLDGIFYVLHTGCSWEAMPAKFGSPKRARCMYYHWKRTGIFEQIWELCSNLYGVRCLPPA